MERHMPAALCDIIVPIWNQPELTRRCLMSVIQSTREPIRFILIDNGSDTPTRDYLDQVKAGGQASVHLIRNKENLGFIKAINQGISASQAPWICLLNNDTVVTPGWLTEMLLVAQAGEAIGLVNPTSNSLGFHPGDIPLEKYAATLAAESGKWAQLSTALGFCLLARKSIFEKIGGLDESFGMGYFEDDDLSKRVKQAGLRCVRACASYVYHQERGSFRHLPQTKESFQKNRQLFESRWGGRLRILWGVSTDQPGLETVPLQPALEVLGKGHWISFCGPERAVPQEVLAHAQAGQLKAGSSHWRLNALARLVIRRRKPYQLVISFDDAWSAWIQRFSWFHQAQLLHKPTPEQILLQCENLSSSR